MSAKLNAESNVSIRRLITYEIMAYRLSQLDIPVDDPFRNDALERRSVVEFLAGLIDRTGGPFVLSLDSAWGSGKTTLVRMLQAQLTQQNFCCIYFNAWQVDYVTDPLVALVSCIDGLELGESGAAASFKSHLKTVRRVTSLVAKRTVVAAAKALTVGALDLEEEVETAVSELAGESVKDIVDAFQRESSLLDKFRRELEAAVAQLPAAGKKPTLILFIDEVDRCRPTFAIELLERIKHLFDISNIVFVLSLDKAQLEASLSAVYGVNINSAEYLRRFIDLEYVIPAARTKRFVESLFSRFGLDEIFAKRTHAELRSDKSNFLGFFSDLADVMHLSLRAQERCLTRLRVVMDQTPENQYLHPILVALLIVLRSSEPGLFKRLSGGQASTKEVMEYLNGMPGAQKLTAEHSGMILEAYLLAADDDGNRSASALTELEVCAKDQNVAEPLRRRAGKVLEMVQHIGSPFRGSPKLSQLTRKIDLAAGLRE